MRTLARLLLGLLWLSWCALRALEPSPLSSPEGRVSLAGQVEEIHCTREDRCRLILTAARADAHPVSEPVTLMTDGDPEGLVSPGDWVEISAFMRAERLGSNPGFHASFSPPKARWRAWQTPGASIRHARGEPPWRLSPRVFAHLEPETRALLQAMILGERRDLSQAQRDAFVDTGTAHLLAISGLHLAVIGWGLYRLALLLLSLGPWAQTRALPPFAALLSLASVWAYVLGICPSPATQRAATLMTFLMLGILLGRAMRPHRALGLTALVLLSIDPKLALGASFQLSFSAVAALILLRPRLRALEAWLGEPGRLEGALWQRSASWLSRATLASLATTLATAPLTLSWFGQVALWGVLFNLVAVPLTSLLVVPSAMTWFVLAHLAPEIALPLAWIPEEIASTLLELVSAWAAWTGPGHVAAWPHGLGVLGSLGVLALIRGGRSAWFGSALCASVIIFTLPPPPSGLRISALNVGHGDALVVEGPEGRVALVDTGGSAHDAQNDALATWTLIPALARLGHSHLDALVLTHADLDHIGAADRLAERLHISELWLPPCSLDSPRVRRLASRLNARGGRIRVLRRDDSLRWGGLSWKVLWPAADFGCAFGPNESGLSLRLDYAGRRILMTADLGHLAESELLAEPDRLRADVLKVGHHGSRGSSSPAFLDAVSPRMALVSGRFVGGRMPPHRDVLEALCRRGIHLKLTGRDGALMLSVDHEGGMSLEGLRPP